MHTDTTPKEKPTGSANYPAGHTDHQIVPAADKTSKRSAALAPHFVLASHTLIRSNPVDGAVLDQAGRWGWHRSLPELQAAHFVAHIAGGA